MSRIMEKLLHRRTLRHWGRIANKVETAPLNELRRQQNRARQLKSRLDRLLHVAEGRLALPHIGSSSFPTPHGSDWSWHPEAWRGPLPVPGLSSVPSKAKVGSEVQVFHDCAYSELTLRQLRNTREEDLAPHGLRLDVFNFDGSFLSLVIALPQGALEGLTRQHLIRFDTIVETERPLEIFARLNISHGPNTEQIVRELPHGERRMGVEFDLAYTKINEKRVKSAWLDLIFEAPEMNQVVLRDLTFARHRRANL
ncbi:MAG: hypothetical protein GJ678_16950 [Rhodobacteraceae bacterium]|nr:hypothetical protein [Paracoccaceae bacterium]